MRLCAFCPSPATKKGEHIFDNWLNKDEDGSRISRDYHMTSEGRSTVDALSYRSRSINITRPVVCGPCNNGWMSDITNFAKDVAEGAIRYAQPTSLSAEGIATLAAYAFLKAAVVDYAITLDGHRPFFQPKSRVMFRDELAIPNGTQIWLAHHGSNRDLQSGHAWSTTLQLYSGIVKGFDFYLFTYFVGHLVLQLTCPRWRKNAARRPKELPVLIEAKVWRHFTVPIWPDVQQAEWPPHHQLDSHTLQKLRDRFRNLQAPIERPL